MNTSELLAGSVNTNPIVIRKIMSLLKKAELVHVRLGVAVAKLAKNLVDITLLDVYKAVNSVNNEELFSVHEQPNANYVIGRNSQQTIELIFMTAQAAMEKVLELVTLEAIVISIQQHEQQ